jgi:hypothetical protein
MSIQISVKIILRWLTLHVVSVLGANVLRGPKQIPWDGKLQYDYQLWIDSDIVFDTNKFWQLCDLALSEDGMNAKLLLGGMQQKMVTQLLSHTG